MNQLTHAKLTDLLNIRSQQSFLVVACADVLRTPMTSGVRLYVVPREEVKPGDDSDPHEITRPLRLGASHFRLVPHSEVGSYSNDDRGAYSLACTILEIATGYNGKTTSDYRGWAMDVTEFVRSFLIRDDCSEAFTKVITSQDIREWLVAMQPWGTRLRILLMLIDDVMEFLGGWNVPRTHVPAKVEGHSIRRMFVRAVDEIKDVQRYLDDNPDVGPSFERLMRLHREKIFDAFGIPDFCEKTDDNPVGVAMAPAAGNVSDNPEAEPRVVVDLAPSEIIGPPPCYQCVHSIGDHGRIACSVAFGQFEEVQRLEIECPQFCPGVFGGCDDRS